MSPPRTRLARIACALALSVLSACFGFERSDANPAARVTREFVQPNGTPVTLRLWGDEFANGWETVNGLTVVLEEASGFWCYAGVDATGNLMSTQRKVGIDPPITSERLRPSHDVIEARRDLLSDSAELNAPPAWATGTVNVLVIMVQFPADAGDPNGAQPAVNASFTAAQMQGNLFGATATGPGNWSDYINEVSYGNMNVVGTVVGPFTVANDKNDYDDGPSSAAALVQEAIALADPSVDFTPFDNDGNGQVDMVAICYAGNGPDNGLYNGANTTTNNLWPHAWNIGAVNVDGGARSVREYFIAPELLNNTPRMRTIGVYVHEFGHKIGLPDLYDTDGNSQGVGHWCLMGTGSWCSDTPGTENGESPSHMSAWAKYFMGWITPVDQTDQQIGLNVPRAEDNAYAIRLLANPGGNDWPGSGEYFLIENRQRTLFDVGLDGCGILVWHIDEARANNEAQGHTSGTHRLVDLEEAHGGTQQLDIPEPPPGTNNGNRGDGGDPFPGTSSKVQWDGASDPSSDLYNGNDSNQRMRVLATACASSMSISLNNLPPVSDAGSDQLNVECTGPTGASVNLNGTGSSDPDGDGLTYTWTATGITFSNPNSATPTATFPEGSTTVTLEVSDGIETDTDQMTVQVVDTTPPSVTCPAAIQVECSESGGTPATDPAIVAFLAGATATDACDTAPVITNDAPAFFPHGTTTVVFTATDGSTNSDTCHTTVEVIDTTPPTISLSLSRDALWPPNHKMADITATLVVDDVCDPNPTVVLTSITSDEPDNGLGDGDTPNDIGGASFNTADFLFQLRSERSGGGDGRVYTVIYTASDADGNTASDTAWVRVPHSRKGIGNSSGGFALDGLSVAPGAERFTIVIPTNLEQNAVRIDASRACLGNTEFVLAPAQWWLADVTGDRLPDLVLEYSNAELAVKTGVSDEVDSETLAPRDINDEPDPIGIGDEADPIGLHYISLGTDFVIDDVFALGVPMRIEGTRPLTTEAAVVPAPPSVSLSSPAPINTPPVVSAYDGRTLTLATPGRVRFDVFNIQGRRIRTVVDGSFGIGSRPLTWDGNDEGGRRAPSGVYLYRVTGPGLHATRKITLMR